MAHEANDLYSESACEYCGNVADTIDHVPPQCIRPTLINLKLTNRFPFFEVKACRECNSLLGKRMLWTFRQRKKFIRRALRLKYKEVLALPDWSDSEIKQLNGNLKDFVIKRAVLKEFVRARLRRSGG